MLLDVRIQCGGRCRYTIKANGTDAIFDDRKLGQYGMEGGVAGKQENSSALVAKLDEEDADQEYAALVKEQADGYLGTRE